MAQWFHVYEMHDGIVSLVLRTFTAQFPYVEVWDPGNGDVVMLGSLQPWPSCPKQFRPGFDLAGVRADLAAIGIPSAEALWARQLASQRTAFAIAGDGPVQSDLFPVLEYAAPRAFYIGINAELFTRYDERTRQQLLAPSDKLLTLHSLSLAEARSIFSSFSSVNGELLESLRERGAQASGPCVFNTHSPRVAVPALPADHPTSAATLNRAASLVSGTQEQQREAVALIESVVAGPASAADPSLAAWTSLAATAAASLGDLPQAARLSDLALKQNPADPQALFLLRIIARPWHLDDPAPGSK